MATRPIAARLDEETLDRLDILAKELDRPRAWLMTKAIEQFVAQEEEFIKAVHEGIRAADSGDFVSDRKIKSAFTKWGVKVED